MTRQEILRALATTRNTISFHHQLLTLAELQELQGLPIENLILGDGDYTAEHLRTLQGLPLKRLTLARMDLTSEHLRALQGLAISQLELQGSHFETPDDLIALQGMQIDTLDLGAAQVKVSNSDEQVPFNLRSLHVLPLKALCLQRVYVTDKQLRSLKGLQLSEIRLGLTDLMDMSGLLNLPVRKLFLNYRPVTGDHIRTISRLPLEYLDLSGSTAQGEDLKYLSAPDLTQLYLFQTPAYFDKAALVEFRDRHPHCKMDV